jgi:hypothetical protein
VHAAEAAKGRSKAKAQKAADAAELWKEEAIVILSHEEELVGKKGPKILAYTGCDRLVAPQGGEGSQR